LGAVELDLQTAGSVVLMLHASNFNSVVLASGAVPGKITFTASPGSPLPASVLTSTTGIGVTGNLNNKPGNGIIITTTGGAEDDLGELVSASGGAKTSLTIQGGTTGVTLSAETAIVE
jgi:hypothetical protein